jgi:hypothetical protein
MTTLSATPVDPHQLNLLDLVADTQTPTGKPFADAFKDACLMDAELNAGQIHPSRVSAILHDALSTFDPRRFSAMWAPACGPNGFMDKTDIYRPIDPNVSRGNGAKEVRLRKLRTLPEDVAA